ncbi:MAG: hypothetical protein LIO54_05965 [Oscillospiraceae bacterium]|nr:hypothetical protein [Oscillospiraceae bacterium]
MGDDGNISQVFQMFQPFPLYFTLSLPVKKTSVLHRAAHHTRAMRDEISITKDDFTISPCALQVFFQSDAERQRLFFRAAPHKSAGANPCPLLRERNQLRSESMLSPCEPIPRNFQRIA